MVNAQEQGAPGNHWCVFVVMKTDTQSVVVDVPDRPSTQQVEHVVSKALEDAAALVGKDQSATTAHHALAASEGGDDSKEDVQGTTAPTAAGAAAQAGLHTPKLGCQPVVVSS